MTVHTEQGPVCFQSNLETDSKTFTAGQAQLVPPQAPGACPGPGCEVRESEFRAGVEPMEMQSLCCLRPRVRSAAQLCGVLRLCSEAHGAGLVLCLGSGALPGLPSRVTASLSRLGCGSSGPPTSTAEGGEEGSWQKSIFRALQAMEPVPLATRYTQGHASGKLPIAGKLDAGQVIRDRRSPFSVIYRPAGQRTVHQCTYLFPIPLPEDCSAYIP